MKTISEETIKKILKVKESLMINGIEDEQKNIVYMPEPINPIAYGMEKSVIFYEVAGIKVVEIIGTDENKGYEPWISETGKTITHLPKPNDGEKVTKA